MRIINFSEDLADPIARFESERASSVSLGHGQGDIHVYAVHFDSDGIIGIHPTGYCQLFLVAHGKGWVAGADGIRVQLQAGQGAYFELGENHSKGSAEGMMAIMVQASQLSPDGTNP